MKRFPRDWMVLLIIVLLPFERLLTFEVAGFTVKPAYLVALIWVVFLLCKYVQKFLFKRDSSTSRENLGSVGMTLGEYVLLGLVAWSYLSSIWSLDARHSLVSSSLLLFLAFVFMLLRRKMTEKLRSQITNIVIYLGLAVSIFALLQFLLEPVLGYKFVMLREQYGSRVFGFARPQGTFLEPLYLANFLFWPAMLVSRKLKSESKKWVSIWSILVVTLVAFILTLSRGAYLGMAVALIVMLTLGLYLKKVDWAYIAKIFGGIIAAAVISLALVFAVAGKGGVVTFVQHAASSSDLAPSNQVEELKNRGVSQENAKSQFLEHPIVGIGANAFGALPQFELLRQQGDWQTVNNEYLELLVELGLVGFIIFVAFLVMLFSHIFAKIKAGEYQYIFYGGALVALLVQWTTFSSLNILYIWVFLAVIWPVSNSKIKAIRSK